MDVHMDKESTTQNSHGHAHILRAWVEWRLAFGVLELEKRTVCTSVRNGGETPVSRVYPNDRDRLKTGIDREKNSTRHKYIPMTVTGEDWYWTGKESLCVKKIAQWPWSYCWLLCMKKKTKTKKETVCVSLNFNSRLGDNPPRSHAASVPLTIF